MPGRIVSFHSYAGGVGKTMAIANLALRLARVGLKVCAMDWSFMAPGLHYWLHPRNESSCDGLLEFFSKYSNAWVMGEPDRPTVLPFCHDVEGVDLGSAGGSLKVILCGRLERYFENYSRNHERRWHDFYEDTGGGTCVEIIRDDLIKNFDIVLVDTEAGYTLSGGPSVLQIPDGVVLMAPLSGRPFNGSLGLATTILLAPCGERADRPIPETWFVASRFMATEEGPAGYRAHVEYLKTFFKEHEEFDTRRVWSARSTWTENKGDLLAFPFPEVVRWPVKTLAEEPVTPLSVAYDAFAERLATWLKTPPSDRRTDLQRAFSDMLDALELEDRLAKAPTREAGIAIEMRASLEKLGGKLSDGQKDEIKKRITLFEEAAAAKAAGDDKIDVGAYSESIMTYVRSLEDTPAPVSSAPVEEHGPTQSVRGIEDRIDTEQLREAVRRLDEKLHGAQKERLRFLGRVFEDALTFGSPAHIAQSGEVLASFVKSNEAMPPHGNG